MGTFTYNLAHSLSRLGHRVTVISYGSDSRSDRLDGSVRVIRFPWEGRRFPLLRNSLNSLRYSAGVSRELVRLIREEEPDVIHVPEYRAEGFWFSMFGRSKIPMVIRFSTPHWLVWEINFADGREKNRKPSFRDVDFAMMKYLERKVCRSASARISPSRDLAKLLQSHEKISLDTHVIQTGVDAQRFFPGNVAALREEYGLIGKKVILYVGRLEQRKGCHLIAQALPRVVRAFPDAVLVMIGQDTDSSPDGMTSMKEYVTRFLRDAGLLGHMIHIDRLPHHRLPDFYALGDIFCAPSIYENFANVILEAMATGLPIVTTAQGGSLEAVEEGENGLLVPVNDVIALGNAIVQLLEDDQLRIAMANRNREKSIEQFGLERMAKGMVRVYESAIQGRATR